MKLILPRSHVEELSRRASSAGVDLSTLIRVIVRDGLTRRPAQVALAAPSLAATVPADAVVHRLALGMYLERDLRRFAAHATSQLGREVSAAAVARAAVAIHLTGIDLGPDD